MSCNAALRDLIRSGEARRLRRAAGITQKTLAAALGLSRPRMCEIEAGLRKPPAWSAPRYLAILRKLAARDEVTAELAAGLHDDVPDYEAAAFVLAAVLTVPDASLPAMAAPQPEVPEYRPWHLPGCPARSAAVADEDACAVCTCPAERFLDPWAEPVPGPGDVPEVTESLPALHNHATVLPGTT